MEQPSDLRFGFTLIYNREIALKHPFQDKNLGEDYDWCMELMDPGLLIGCCFPVSSFSLPRARAPASARSNVVLAALPSCPLPACGSTQQILCVLRP